MLQTTFVFYSKSANAKPGKGVHEYIDASQVSNYEPLSLEPDWRKVLSNFDISPFEFEGKTYQTIEHVFQAKKLAIADPSQAERFTVESGDPIGLGDGAMAQKHRKLVKLTLAQLEQWDHIKRDVMERAARQKFAEICWGAVWSRQIAPFAQSPDKLRILKLTEGAKLVHLMTARGQKSTLDHFDHLERIRRDTH